MADVNGVSPEKPKQSLNVKIEAMTRQYVRVVALIILSYLAWRGVAGLLESAHLAAQFAAYVTVMLLLALFWLV